jgi:hypothetical protein
VSSNRPPVGSTRRRFTSIPGFSDQKEMPRIAKLRLGIRDKKGTDKEHPRETDHFVLDVEESVAPDAANEIRKRFSALFGERPQILTNVRLISADRDESFSSAYEWWRAGKMFCHGNGAEALRKNEGQWKEYGPCANGGCPDYGPKKCSLISRLRFMLPEVSVSGYFQIDTGSVYSAANVRNGLNLVAALTQQLYGEPRIHAVPLTLSRVPQPIEFDGKLNTHFILHLQPQNFTLESLTKELSEGPRLLTAAIPAIPEDEEDLPAELIAESEQQEEEVFDPATEDFISAAIPLLKWNDGTIAAKRTQYRKQSDLREHVAAEVTRATDAYFKALQMPERDAKDLRSSLQPLELLGNLTERWFALPEATRKARRGAAA